MEKRNSIKKIILTGPESTGKSFLCKKLAKYYKTVCVEEYSRKYIENLKRKYTFDDIIHIARKQIKQQNEYNKKGNKFIFFDTNLIITKIWLEQVYGKVPGFISKFIGDRKNFDLFLLCYPDIKWIKDNVRENGGEKRKYLFDIYENELKINKLNYKIIKGTGEKRFLKAQKTIELFFNKKN